MLMKTVIVTIVLLVPCFVIIIGNSITLGRSRENRSLRADPPVSAPPRSDSEGQRANQTAVGGLTAV